MTITGIAILILFGLLLLAIELLLIPGISIAAAGSFLLILAGVLLAFVKYGTLGGIITLMASLVAVACMFYLFFKPATWRRMALNTNIDSKDSKNTGFHQLLAGQTGFAISRIAPVGEVNINGNIFEAYTVNEFIDANTPIEILKIDDSKIIIKKLSI